MEFIKAYGLTIWLAVAAACMLLGSYLTVRRSRSQTRPQNLDIIAVEQPHASRRKLRALSMPNVPALPPHRTPVVCPACGQQDDLEARYCGACGHPLSSVASARKQTSAPRWSSGTRLVTRL